MTELTLTNVSFYRGERPILREIDFAHQGGRILTLLGPSGSGKTTLLWLIAGLLKPTGGSIHFSRKPNLGMVFQDSGLWEHATVRTHLEVVLKGRHLSRHELSRRVEQMLEQTGLSQLSPRRPGELSGGERQRLALARALVVEPDWLLLDEPTSSLDGPARDAMIELLERQLRSSSAGVVLATHQVDLAMRLSDEIAILQEGMIAQRASPVEVYRNPKTLQISRLLGPASEISSELLIGSAPAGSSDRIIARPQEIRFAPEMTGAARVIRSHFTGAFWQIEVALPQGERAIASSPIDLELGTVGQLHWQTSDVPERNVL